MNIMPCKITPALLFAAVVALWLTTLCVLVLVLPDWGSRGQFGDLFGSINALFSGLAFAALYSSIRVQQSQLETQQNELALQREELKLQREEMAAQREEMAASREELANQVRVQWAQFNASVAQILVAKAQAQIEAIKMDSEQVSVTGRTNYVKEIVAIANSLGELSNSLKEQAKSAA